MQYWFRNLSKVKKIALFTALFFVITTGGVSAWFFGRITDVGQMFPGVDFDDPNHDDPDIKDVRDAFDNRTLNILLMGFDRNAARDEIYAVYRPDTLMLAAINLETSKIDIISIPRDTLVPIYNRRGGKDKINHAYYYGWRYGGAPSSDPEGRHQLGIQSQIETVSLALKGIPIHYYVSIDMDGVVEVVNIMGGVWYEVEERVYHNYGHVIAEPGYQKLDGQKFLQFVRSREWAQGDYQRAQNQQAIMVAAFDQFKKANKLIHAPQVLLTMNNSIDTNLTMEQILSLAWFGTQKVDTENISNHVLEGEFAYGRLHDGQRSTNIYYLIDQQKRVELIQAVWGITVTADAPDVLLPRLSPDDDLASDDGSPDYDEAPSDSKPDPGPGNGQDPPDNEPPGDEPPDGQEPEDPEPPEDPPGDGDEEPPDEEPGDPDPPEEEPPADQG